MSQSPCESEITRLAHKMKWPVLESYKKHVKTDSSFEENLLTLLRLENEQRDKALVRRLIKQAGFPIVKTLDAFEFNQTMLPHLKQEQEYIRKILKPLKYRLYFFVFLGLTSKTPLFLYLG